MCLLASHYQFFREALFSLEKGGTFVLLSDDRNPTFSFEDPASERGLVPFLLKLIPKQHQRQMGHVSIQSVVKAIESSPRNEWIGRFKIKYGIDII